MYNIGAAQMQCCSLYVLYSFRLALVNALVKHSRSVNQSLRMPRRLS